MSIRSRLDPTTELNHHPGLCIWFTGLSAAGKTTTAECLTGLMEKQGRTVTLLDGDTVRMHLSKGLGFSKEDRDTNLRRIGFVAAEIVRHGGIVVCATVSPYIAIRQEIRETVGDSAFIEVFVNTPLEICEQRDPKGLYARAKRGEILNFTGIDDPYEPPVTPEISLETVIFSPEDNACLIIDYLRQRGLLF